MNDTRQQEGLDQMYHLKPLIEKSMGKQYEYARVVLCRNSSVEQVSGKNNSYERENFPYRKTVLAMRIRYKNQIIHVPDTVNQNELLLAERMCTDLFGSCKGGKKRLARKNEKENIFLFCCPAR
jgi:hypothetical protein